MALKKSATKKASNGRANGRGGGRGASGRGGGRGRGSGQARGGGRGLGRGPLPWKLKASLCATGGRIGRKLFPLETTQAVDSEGKIRTFAKIETTCAWLAKSVTGGWLYKALKMCPILKQIRGTFLAAIDPDAYEAPDPRIETHKPPAQQANHA